MKKLIRTTAEDQFKRHDLPKYQQQPMIIWQVTNSKIVSNQNKTPKISSKSLSNTFFKQSE